MGPMVLLQGVMLQGAARRVRTVPNSCCKGASEGCCCALQGAVVGFFSEAAGPVANGCKEKSSQNTSSDLANVPRFRIGKFEVWFGYDSGMIRGMIRKPIFFLNSGSFVAWVSFSHRQPTTIATLSMAAMARPARRPWTGPEYEECEDLNAHLWFISAGLPASLLDVLLMYL